MNQERRKKRSGAEFLVNSGNTYITTDYQSVSPFFVSNAVL